MAFLEGKVTGVYLGLQKKSIVTTQFDFVYADYGGLKDENGLRDRHSGSTRITGDSDPGYTRGIEISNDRQITAASEEELKEIAQALGLKNLPAEWLGLNLLVTGILPFTFLPPQTKLFFPDRAVISLTGENLPCLGPGEIINEHYPEIPANKFPRAAIHKRGVTGTIERPGIININDKVKVQLGPGNKYFFPRI